MALFLRGVRGYRAALGGMRCPSTLTRPRPHTPSGALLPSSRDPFSSASLYFFTSANFATRAARMCSTLSRVHVSTPWLSTPSSSVPDAIGMRPCSHQICLFSSSSRDPASSALAQKSPDIFRALKAGDGASAAGVPSHLRHPLRGSAAESLADKMYRWLDVTGVLTRWNSRKEWVLDLIPMNRLGSATVTEFERKQEMFVTLNAQILALIAIYLAYSGIQHVNVKPANPAYEGFPGVDGRKKDFTLTNRLVFIEPKERCKECRWLDLECKKECFTRLKAEGYKLFVNKGDPLTIPRTKLEPPHFH